LERFARVLQAKNHGLLIEDAGVKDCAFLAEHRDLITHVKLERAMTQGLVERRVPQDAVNALVQCAKKEGMRVIALAVDNADLLPMLFAAGVDAIQGHFVSMPYRNLMYPSIQRVESSSGPAWQGPVRSV
jgi:EAL domain-containing protein (putative c-di-GMP-specific phosphodiesterase class I)